LIDPSNPNNSIQLGGGLITVNRQFGDEDVASFFLSRVDSVSVVGGGNGVLPGYWSSIPAIAVGFTSIGTFSPQTNLDQEVVVTTDGVNEISDGIYGFTTNASLLSSSLVQTIQGGAGEDFTRLRQDDPMPDYVWRTPVVRIFNATSVHASFIVGTCQLQDGWDGRYYKRNFSVAVELSAPGANSWSSYGEICSITAPRLYESVLISGTKSIPSGTYDLRFCVTVTTVSGWVYGREQWYPTRIHDWVYFNGGKYEVSEPNALYDGDVLVLGVGR
jgi:hypothetical protein